MAWTPISGVIPQYQTSTGALASGYYLKFYASGTSTAISMATGSGGGSTLDKCQLDSSGYPTTDGTTRFIPHIAQTYKIILYKNATDADNNTTSNADWVIDNIAQSAAAVAETQVSIENQLGSEASGSVFTLNDFSYALGVNNLLVYRNGNLQRLGSSFDYSETSSTSITTTSTPLANDTYTFVKATSTTSISADASTTTYTPAGSGAQATNVQAKLRESVSVKDFGAVLDGVTDDYAAVAAALAVSDTVYIPAGNMLVGTTISMGPSQRLYGAGFRETFITASGGITSVIEIDDFCCVEDLRVEGEGAGTTTNAIKIKTGISGCSKWKLDTVLLRGCTNGLHMQACWLGSLYHTFYDQCTNGIYLSNTDGDNLPVNAISFFGGEIANCTYGVRIGTGGGSSFGVNNLNFYNFTIEPDATYGVWIESGAAFQIINFNGCYFEACGNAILRQDSGGGTIKFDSCLLFLDSNASTDKGLEVTAGSTQSLMVINCRFARGASSTATDGLNFGASASINKVVLINNVWDNAAIVIVNNMSAGFNILSIADERAGTKLPAVDSMSAGTDPNSEQWMGKATATTASTLDVTLGSTEADATYKILVFGMSWDTTYWITNRTTTSFRINWGTALGAGTEEIYYQLYRR